MGTLRPVLMSNGEIAQRYLAGTPIGEIALRCSTSHAIIRAILVVQGVPIRSPAEVRQLASADRRARIERRRRALLKVG
jgi:hypothetical protein